VSENHVINRSYVGGGFPHTELLNMYCVFETYPPSTSGSIPTGTLQSSIHCGRCELYVVLCM